MRTVAKGWRERLNFRGVCERRLGHPYVRAMGMNEWKLLAHW